MSSVAGKRWRSGSFVENRLSVGAIVIVAALSAVGCGGSGKGGGSASPTGASLPPSSTPSAAQVTYTAGVFMAGMRVTVPSAGWSIFEDHPGEFNLAAPLPATANIHFWLDPYLSLADDKPNPGLGRTPAAIVAWMKGNPSFIVSGLKTVRIASGTTATTFMLDLSDSCIDYFVFRAPGYDFPYGTCPGTPVSLFLATLGSGAKAHTFVIAIDAKNKKTFAAVDPTAERIIATVMLPPTVSAG
jgi:hypothetical protein